MGCRKLIFPLSSTRFGRTLWGLRNVIFLLNLSVVSIPLCKCWHTLHPLPFFFCSNLPKNSCGPTALHVQFQRCETTIKIKLNINAVTFLVFIFISERLQNTRYQRYDSSSKRWRKGPVVIRTAVLWIYFIKRIELLFDSFLHGTHLFKLPSYNYQSFNCFIGSIFFRQRTMHV